MTSHTSLLRSFIVSLASEPQETFFDKLCQKIDDHFLLPSRSISEVKRNKNGLKGSFFEYMCLALVQQGALAKLDAVESYLFADIPETLRTAVGFGRQDNGIDMVVKHSDGRWSAVQCKYRKQPRKSTFLNPHTGKTQRTSWTVPWDDLSTFYSLCERRKPRNGWKSHVVMTNAPSVSRKGGRHAKDVKVCRKDMRSIPKHAWMSIVGLQGHTLSESAPSVESAEENTPETPNLDEIRKKRLEAFAARQNNL